MLGALWMSGVCLEGIERVHVGCQVGLEFISLKEQQQPLMDFKKGVIVKIYKSSVDPILVGGACAAPKLRWASPQDL